jgi:hypothetical protein
MLEFKRMTMDEIQNTREERIWESWNLKKTMLENGGIN